LRQIGEPVEPQAAAIASPPLSEMDRAREQARQRLESRLVSLAGKRRALLAALTTYQSQCTGLRVGGTDAMKVDPCPDARGQFVSQADLILKIERENSRR
jgi:hypothetical protein